MLLSKNQIWNSQLGIDKPKGLLNLIFIFDPSLYITAIPSAEFLRRQNLVAGVIISQIGYNNILVIFLLVLSSDPLQISGKGGLKHPRPLL